jgi:hypothetical protein
MVRECSEKSKSVPDLRTIKKINLYKVTVSRIISYINTYDNIYRVYDGSPARTGDTAGDRCLRNILSSDEEDK